jgi:hypothetical protein
MLTTKSVRPRALVDLRGVDERDAWEKIAQRTQELWARTDRPIFVLEDKTWLDRVRVYGTSYGSR